MKSQVVSVDSLISIDIGTISTRAFLFDGVNDQYRFIAAGEARTTDGPPYHDIQEGVTIALQQLEEITGRNLLGANGYLVTPTQAEGSGVDAVVATLSAGPELRVVAVGLLEGVSLESARNLATSTYAKIVETISLNDRRKQDTRIDAILRARPDLIVIAGGINGGASQSVQSLLDVVGVSSYLKEKPQRPAVLFAGNNAIKEDVEEMLAHIVDLHIAPNIRPTIQREQLTPAQTVLADIFQRVRSEQIDGLAELAQQSTGRILPTATGLGRVINFLGRIYDPNKGVLGIDVGASATTVAAANQGNMALQVFPQFGLGESLGNIFKYIPLEQIVAWLQLDIPPEHVRDYIYTKASYPASLPETEQELLIEQAITRQLIHNAVYHTTKSLPFGAKRAAPSLLPWLEPIIVSGSVLTKAPTPGQSLLVLLDGLQPTGITTIVLDQNNLIGSLGATADINPLLTVQVLESNAFLNLATVIAPVGKARKGTPILRVHITYRDGEEMTYNVKYGTIEVIPLAVGESAQLHLQPLHRFDVGMGGPGRSGRVQVTGGVLGIVVDGRGRPIDLVSQPDRRRETLKRWHWALKGNKGG